MKKSLAKKPCSGATLLLSLWWLRPLGNPPGFGDPPVKKAMQWSGALPGRSRRRYLDNPPQTCPGRGGWLFEPRCRYLSITQQYISRPSPTKQCRQPAGYIVTPPYPPHKSHDSHNSHASVTLRRLHSPAAIRNSLKKYVFFFVNSSLMP